MRTDLWKKINTYHTFHSREIYFLWLFTFLYDIKKNTNLGLYQAMPYNFFHLHYEYSHYIIFNCTILNIELNSLE